MLIIIEEYQYPAEKVESILDGITKLKNVDGNISVNYVGYYYNPTERDCVFILPKVLLEYNEATDGKELVFGKYKPEDIIHVENCGLLTEEERTFIYHLSVWIYRAIVVFNDHNEHNDIVRKQFVSQMAKGRLRQSNTFLDILLAIQKFNKENQDFFFFVLKNIHSGYNKINWTKTISQKQAIIQEGEPIYLEMENKKRKINFDEELLVIFFSVLNYMREEYGFPVNIAVGFELITGAKFRQYMNGMGCTRLHQIKYKYFSDKALYLWELCFAFFDQSKKINVETTQQEYLLVRNFNIVFEAIIDDLVGDDKRTLPTVLTDQEDGKRVDHMFRWKDLTDNQDGDQIYYIGDSKYYKQKTPLGRQSVYKQYTYARNVIQWNMNLFLDGSEEEKRDHVKLRDDITEGYNIIPNFFISANQNELKMSSEITQTGKDEQAFQSRQFENRLFDRDTFLLAHYDVNFLYVVALYGRNNKSQKEAWRKDVRDKFRTAIQGMLKEKIEFYAMTAHPDVDAEQYMKENFSMVLGKVFTPFEDKEYFSLALDRSEKFKEDNEILRAMLEQSFTVKSCPLGVNPATILEKPVRTVKSKIPAQFLTKHWLEMYQDANILVGCVKNQQHYDWILGKNDKGTLIYNVRLGKGRDGSQIDAQLISNKVTFVVLYELGHEGDSPCRVFRVHHTAHMTKERMAQAWYPNPQSNKYFCYVFDEEVTLGDLDIATLLFNHRFSTPDFVNGAPIYLKGRELMAYRN